MLSSLGPELRRAAVAERLVRAGGFVPADPICDGTLSLAEVGEAQEPHALPLERPEEPFDRPVGLKRQLLLVPTLLVPMVRDGSASRTPSTRYAASGLSC